MKTKIMIVEDNYYRYYTMHQLIETQLKIKVAVVAAQTEEEVIAASQEIAPKILIIRPRGGILELMGLFRERGINCRNASVSIVVVPENANANVGCIEQAANKRCALEAAA